MKCKNELRFQGEVGKLKKVDCYNVYLQGPEAEESGKEAKKGAGDVEREEAGRESSQGGKTPPKRRVHFKERVEEAVENLNQIEEEVEIVKEKLSSVAE